MSRHSDASALSDDFPYDLAEITSLSVAARTDLLIKHLDRYSIRRGEFTLKSGRTSNWFIDSKATACHPQGMLLVTSLIIDLLPPEVNAIGGLTMGADPVAFTTAAIANCIGRGIFAYSIRKEVKDHGAGGRVAGFLPSGAICAIVEDTVTRGTSMLEALDATIGSGAKVAMATAIVDRGGTVGSLMDERGVFFNPLVKAPDLGFEYESS